MTPERIHQLLLEWDGVLQKGAASPRDMDAPEELRLRLLILKGTRELERERRAKTGYLYLACPYSHSRPEVRHYRFETATAISAVLMAQGIHVYSPLTHGHPMAEAGAVLPHRRWLVHAQLFLERAKAFGVLQLHGWDSSDGVAYEQGLAEKFALPRFPLDPVKGIETLIPRLKEVLGG